uniref:non-specific serine/threonine protein kinase n=1 Tax=Strongyloides papillosus TaxID=174720 RepID=A0A0N5BWL3_STREA
MPNVPTLDKNRTIECDFCKFKVIKLLGLGGFGAVYLVEEINKKSKYAVKTELMHGKKRFDVKSKDQCFSDNTSWKIAEQTLEALEAFHSAGFVHRDIKPHNYTIGGHC